MNIAHLPVSPTYYKVFKCVSSDFFVCVYLVMSDSLQPHGHSPQDSSFRAISQARILEWVAISSSRGSSGPRDGTPVTCLGRRL